MTRKLNDIFLFCNLHFDFNFICQTLELTTLQSTYTFVLTMHFNSRV